MNKQETLRWVERLRKSQRLTAREEERKEEVLKMLWGPAEMTEREVNVPKFPP